MAILHNHYEIFKWAISNNMILTKKDKELAYHKFGYWVGEPPMNKKRKVIRKVENDGKKLKVKMIN